MVLGSSSGERAPAGETEIAADSASTVFNAFAAVIFRRLDCRPFVDLVQRKQFRLLCWMVAAGGFDRSIKGDRSMLCRMGRHIVMLSVSLVVQATLVSDLAGRSRWCACGRRSRGMARAE